MKIFKLIGALLLSLLLLGGTDTIIHAQENDLVSEDDAYDSSFSGPLIYCVRKDTETALGDNDSDIQPVLCDEDGKLITTASGGGSVVTNAGTFAVQEDGAALTALEKIDDFISGSEGQVDVITSALPTGASTSAKQLADGHNVTVDNASIAVTATNLDVQIGGSDVVTVDMAGNNDVVATAGLLHANSPTTVAAIVKVFNAGDIAATSMGASTAITITGTGALTKVCVILTTGTITSAEDGDLIFFTTDPTISENTADLTVVKAKQISSIISLTGTDFTTDFATAQINCQKVDEPFTALTHVLWHAKGATAYTDEVIDVLVTYRRDS